MPGWLSRLRPSPDTNCIGAAGNETAILQLGHRPEGTTISVQRHGPAGSSGSHTRNTPSLPAEAMPPSANWTTDQTVFS